MKVNTSLGIQFLPLIEKYEQKAYDIIDNLIYKIKECKEVNVVVTALETVIEGEYENVLKVLNNVLNYVKELNIKSFLVIKFITSPDSILTIEQKTKKFQ